MDRERVIPARLSITLSEKATKMLNAAIQDNPGLNVSHWVSVAIEIEYEKAGSVLWQEYNKHFEAANMLLGALNPGNALEVVKIVEE